MKDLEKHVKTLIHLKNVAIRDYSFVGDNQRQTLQYFIELAEKMEQLQSEGLIPQKRQCSKHGNGVGFGCDECVLRDEINKMIDKSILLLTPHLKNYVLRSDLPDEKWLRKKIDFYTGEFGVDEATSKALAKAIAERLK